jgi:carboxypeptidase T
MTRTHRAHRAVGVVALLVIVLGALAAPTSAAAADFPKGWEGYHTYAEMTADVAAEVTAHPSIIRRFSIGTSYQGRTIWAVKISDNVNVDESEPEVLFDGLTHSDEHMGLEMTLHIMHWLVDSYGVDPYITRLVNTREVWVILAVNPDGAEYDIAGGKYHYWRKNRQPNAHTTAIGTDLNRNFGYRWGAGGRTSENPLAITYRGPAAFSAPETRNVRDFLASRVVNGQQQIKAAITFHESGRLVMWPYGYTYVDIPGDMTRDDHAALAAMGKRMASMNGYKPEQASDLYLTSGTTRDYEYGTYRIFAYTFEMSVKDYPDDSLIASETGRNKSAVIYLIDQAWCPVGALGGAIRVARCGAYDDDFEINRGWRKNLNGTDTATSGSWQIGNPAPTKVGTRAMQLDGTTSGRYALATGLAVGASAAANDLDGQTSVTSQPIDLPATAGQKLQFRWSFAHDATSSVLDEVRFEIVDVAAGTRSTVYVAKGAPAVLGAAWRASSVDLTVWAGRRVEIRISARDGGTNGVVEVAVDDVRITQPQ